MATAEAVSIAYRDHFAAPGQHPGLSQRIAVARSDVVDHEFAVGIGEGAVDAGNRLMQRAFGPDHGPFNRGPVRAGHPTVDLAGLFHGQLDLFDLVAPAEPIGETLDLGGQASGLGNDTVFLGSIHTDRYLLETEAALSVRSRSLEDRL
jgi:hypothetical protein